MIRLLPFFLLFLFLSCESAEMKRVRTMSIADVNLAVLPDSAYIGGFTYGKTACEVRTTIKDRHIVRIDILKKHSSKYTRKAEEIIPRILDKQTPNVDAVSGATVSSKALMKAVERSLTPGKQ
jgi:uncharacterized protein with FMN-binding domain